MKKLIFLLMLALSFNLSFASTNTDVKSKEQLLKELKSFINKNLKYMKKRTDIMEISDVKVYKDRIKYIYKVYSSEKKFNEIFKKKDLLKKFLVFKLKQVTRNNKKDALYKLVKKFNYKIEYYYYLVSNPKKHINFVVNKKEIFN